MLNEMRSIDDETSEFLLRHHSERLGLERAARRAAPPLRTYRVPPLFYDDHIARDLPEQGVSREVGKQGRSYLVEMDEDALRDLLSDADYYSDATTASQMGMPGLAASARATKRALLKQRPDLS